MLNEGKIGEVFFKFLCEIRYLNSAKKKHGCFIHAFVTHFYSISLIVRPTSAEPMMTRSTL